jgi:hypothetical protein
MSQLFVDNIKNRSGGAIGAPSGAVVSGVVTATSFIGSGTSLTGIDATALKDSGGSVKVQANTSGIVVTGVSTFTGNVSVGGTLTYEDVTNVDSVGLITARSGIRIGAGQSVSAVSGIVTYYGDGSQLTGVESGVGNFVASGAIANGQTVVIKADGTVGIVTQTGSATPSVGSPVAYNSVTSNYNRAIFDSNSNKVVIAYMDGTVGGNPGKAVVGTVSGTSISFGSPTTFETGQSDYYAMTFDSNSNKVIIVFRDSDDSGQGKAIVGTVSGTSISFGSAVDIDANTSDAHIGATFDTNENRVVISYRNASEGNAGQAVVGTVSGTSISFGTPVEFNSQDTRNMTDGVVFDSTNNKVVIAYNDDGDSGKGKAVVGTVNGTNISFGTPVEFEAGSTGFPAAVFDSANGKVVISYADSGDSETGKTRVGTVSGTSISFGSVVEFAGGAGVSYSSATYDSTNGKIVVAYRDESNNHGKVVVGTVSGTSISFGSPTTFEAANSYYISATFDSNSGKAVIAYNDATSSYNGTAVVFGANSLVTNLTTENYIGIAAEAIANAATGKVNILGGVNSGQTGLTTAKTYYVQGNGTLATSAGNPSVVAGTSISTTKILIR